MTWASTQRICALWLSTVLLAACSTAPSTNAAPTHIPLTADAPAHGPSAAPSAPAYPLAVGDEIDIKVIEAPQYDQTVKIRPDGKVSLNLVGTVYVAGRSAEDVQNELRERYTALRGSDQNREYLIHVNDELEFKFPYHQQLNDQMRIRPDGKIQLQLVGTVQAEGLTPEELRDELLRRYSKYLKDSDLAVIVRTATSQTVRTAHGDALGGIAGLKPTVGVRSFQTPQIYVTGEVARPGMVAYMPGLTLLQVLAASGGTLPSGDVTKLVILRRTDAQSAAVLRPGLTKAYRAEPTRDVTLEPYDVLLIPPTRVQSLAETLDAYVYKLFAPLKNSTFGYVYGSTKVY
jgi:polysaccharide export outer membrane protein